MKTVLISLVALMAAGSLQAAAPSRGELVVTAGATRYTLSSGHAQLNMLDPASRDLFTRNLKLDDPKFAALWGRVMTGAVQTRHESGDQADTLWFNPLFDSGIVAHWTRVDGQWQAQAVEPVTGAALRGENGLIRPHELNWLRHGGNMGKALSTSAATTFAAAEKGDWSTLYETPGNASAALMRAYEGNAALYQMALTPGYEHALTLLDHLLVSDDPAERKLPAAMRSGLSAYGENARRTLSPVSAYRRKTGWTVAMQSPEAPQIVWLVHFNDPRGDDPAMPRGFVAVGQGPANTKIATETAQ